jgi:hypothetical protein
VPTFGGDMREYRCTAFYIQGADDKLGQTLRAHLKQ